MQLWPASICILVKIHYYSILISRCNWDNKTTTLFWYKRHSSNYRVWHYFQYLPTDFFHHWQSDPTFGMVTFTFTPISLSQGEYFIRPISSGGTWFAKSSSNQCQGDFCAKTINCSSSLLASYQVFYDISNCCSPGCYNLGTCVSGGLCACVEPFNSTNCFCQNGFTENNFQCIKGNNSQSFYWKPDSCTSVYGSCDNTWSLTTGYSGALSQLYVSPQTAGQLYTAPDSGYPTSFQAYLSIKHTIFSLLTNKLFGIMTQILAKSTLTSTTLVQTQN